MKRVIPVIIAFFLICVVYEFGVLFFVKKYDYEYTYTKNKEKYKISEEYNYNDGLHSYNIKIKDKNNTNYIYLINHNYHKEKEIIEDLLVYKKDNMKCIFPIFKDKVTSNIVCNNDNKVESYVSLNEKGNSFIQEVRSDLIKKGYTVPAFKYKDGIKNISNLSTKLTYYDDFISKYNILVWGYKGVFVINKNKSKVNDFLKEDIYDTRYLTIGKKNIYVIKTEDKMSNVDYIYSINLKDGNTSMLDVNDKNISSNSYFNGVYNNTVYLTDCNGNHQYKFTENKDDIEKIDLQGMIKYYDGKNLVNESVDDVTNNYIRFNKNVINEKITKLYNTSEIKSSNGHYYFKTSDGNFYMSLKDNYKNPVLLFNRSNMNEWIVTNDTIFGIIGDTLYAYNYEYGFKPLIKYNEFNYHTDNMFGVIYLGE